MRGTGQSEGDLPGERNVAMVASENPLRPFRAIPRDSGGPSRAASCRVTCSAFCQNVEHFALGFSTYLAIQRSSSNRSDSAMSVIPSRTLFDRAWLSFSLHSLSVPLGLTRSSFLYLSFSLSIISFLSLFLVELLLFPPAPELPVSCT